MHRFCNHPANEAALRDRMANRLCDDCGMLEVSEYHLTPFRTATGQSMRLCARCLEYREMEKLEAEAQG
jgi:hypothetical protein